jgi:uncharacterized protein (DUF1697 family)
MKPTGSTFVALFRGVNIGGRNMLSMKALQALLEQKGCRDVRTYIQSGNVVFRSSRSSPAGLAKTIKAAISERFGFEPGVFVLKRSDLARAVARNPFPRAVAIPTSLHVFFLSEPPRQVDLKALDAIKADGEAFAVIGQAFYLHTPAGFGTSKLAAKAERILGVEATARNWRTVTTLLEMATARVLSSEF